MLLPSLLLHETVSAAVLAVVVLSKQTSIIFAAKLFQRRVLCLRHDCSGPNKRYYFFNTKPSATGLMAGVLGFRFPDRDK